MLFVPTHFWVSQKLYMLLLALPFVAFFELFVVLLLLFILELSDKLWSSGYPFLFDELLFYFSDFPSNIRAWVKGKHAKIIYNIRMDWNQIEMFIYIVSQNAGHIFWALQMLKYISLIQACLILIISHSQLHRLLFRSFWAHVQYLIIIDSI